MTEITLVKVEDTGSHVITIGSGFYLIDGKRITVPYNYNKTEIVVTNPYDIRQMTPTAQDSHYENEEGEKLTVDEYSDTVNTLNLKAHKVWDDEEECYNLEFKDLDDEYAKRKFCRKWKVVRATKEVISEPLPVFEQLVRLDTGNEFIQSLYTTAAVGEDVALYIYHRNNATKKIVADCFTKPGMVYTQGASHSQTEGKKIWGNSNHSHIEYVTAFGKYVFTAEKNSVVKGASNMKGTLAALQKQYEADKKYLETIIESGYNIHFRNPEIEGVLLGDVISEISSISSSVSGLDVKQKSLSSHRAINVRIGALLRKLRESAQGS